MANLKLTHGQQQRNKSIQKSSFKCPDLLILEPRGGYSGLFLELKIETPYKKDGFSIKASKNDHLKGQLQSLSDLSKKGYYACFAWSFESIKSIIDNYMAREL